MAHYNNWVMTNKAPSLSKTHLQLEVVPCQRPTLNQKFPKVFHSSVLLGEGEGSAVMTESMEGGRLAETISSLLLIQTRHSLAELSVLKWESGNATKTICQRKD